MPCQRLWVKSMKNLMVFELMEFHKSLALEVSTLKMATTELPIRDLRSPQPLQKNLKRRNNTTPRTIRVNFVNVREFHINGNMKSAPSSAHNQFLAEQMTNFGIDPAEQPSTRQRITGAKKKKSTAARG